MPQSTELEPWNNKIAHNLIKLKNSVFLLCHFPLGLVSKNSKHSWHIYQKIGHFSGLPIIMITIVRTNVFILYELYKNVGLDIDFPFCQKDNWRGWNPVESLKSFFTSLWMSYRTCTKCWKLSRIYGQEKKRWLDCWGY